MRLPSVPLALVILLVGVAIVVLTTLDALGYFVAVVGAIALIFAAFAGAGTRRV